MLKGKRQRRLFTVPETRSQGAGQGDSERQHCPLLAKQCTVCLPHWQVKAFLQDTDIFYSKKNDRKFKKKSKQRRKELIYVTVIYTQFKYRVKTVKSLGLTKKPLDGHSAVQSQRQMVSLTLVFIPDSFKPSAVQS